MENHIGKRVKFNGVVCYVLNQYVNGRIVVSPVGRPTEFQTHIDHVKFIDKEVKNISDDQVGEK
jgi:hypothetical protein